MYLKGKFRSSNPQDIVEDDIQYVLPLSRPLSGLKIRFRKSFQEFNEVRYTLSMLYPDDASKLELLRMFTKETKTSKLSDLRAIF